MSVDIDLSNWRLDGAVNFQFPVGSELAAGEYLVVASNPDLLSESLDSLHLMGPWLGNLANEGERVELRNHTGRLLNVIEYGDVNRGRWGRMDLVSRWPS